MSGEKSHRPTKETQFSQSNFTRRAHIHPTCATVATVPRGLVRMRAFSLSDRAATLRAADQCVFEAGRGERDTLSSGGGDGGNSEAGGWKFFQERQSRPEEGDRAAHGVRDHYR